MIELDKGSRNTAINKHQFILYYVPNIYIFHHFPDGSPEFSGTNRQNRLEWLPLHGETSKPGSLRTPLSVHPKFQSTGDLPSEPLADHLQGPLEHRVLRRRGDKPLPRWDGGCAVGRSDGM